MTADLLKTAPVKTLNYAVTVGLASLLSYWRKEPILRLADTIIGVAAGIAAAILLNESGRGRRRGLSSQHDGPQADPPG